MRICHARTHAHTHKLTHAHMPHTHTPKHAGMHTHRQVVNVLLDWCLGILGTMWVPLISQFKDLLFFEATMLWTPWYSLSIKYNCTNSLVFFKIYFHLFYGCECIYIFCLHIHICAPCACPWRPEENVKSPGTGVTGVCDPPRGRWEPNPGPLPGQQVLSPLSHLPSYTWHPHVLACWEALLRSSEDTVNLELKLWEEW